MKAPLNTLTHIATITEHHWGETFLSIAANLSFKFVKFNFIGPEF